MSKKHIVCYSGGHSSALVAIEVVRKYGKENVILLNHDIHPSVETADIKRFKKEVADYLGMEITYANHPEWDSKDQFDVVTDAKAFKVGNGTALCTNRLKTAPFDKYLAEHFPVEENAPASESPCVIYYGFDANEKQRIQRRSSILGSKGYMTDYPLAFWERTIQSSKDIGIDPPNTYDQFKHANCIGCLKAGRQHWYIVYCIRPDLWEKAKMTEDTIGYSIIKGVYLEELEPKFELMKKSGVVPTEHIHPKTFWKQVGETLKQTQDEEAQEKPCECVF
jgi:hypothetical protein